VELNVVAPGAPPEIVWPRMLNVGNYNPEEAVAPGDIVAVYGAGLLEGDPITVTTLPLPTKVGTDPDSVQVLVNGNAAPIFYARYGQINIQIPFETSVTQDAQVQVVRNGITSPIGTGPMAPRAPQIVQFGCPLVNDCNYQDNAIGVNFTDGSFPLPATAPFPNSHPAKAGDVITFCGVGFGQATNPLSTGAGAPSSPLPTIDPNDQFCFGLAGHAPEPPRPNDLCTPASYSGATPGTVGLYQINVTIPAGAGTGGSVYIKNSESYSDSVLIVLEWRSRGRLTIGRRG